MLQQAWNFIWSLNYLNSAYLDATRDYYGAGSWVMFDYNRGYFEKPCTSGMMDIFRLPKYVWHFFQSQRNPLVAVSGITGGPMVFIANEWTKRPSPCKIIVFSNCQEVELILNNRSIRRQKPDNGPDTEYSRKREIDLATIGETHDETGGYPFEGGNCIHLDHPPFTFFDVEWQQGSLTAIGYINGKAVARCEVKTPMEHCGIRIDVDDCGIGPSADDVDIIFVRAYLIDENGTIVPDNDKLIQFTAEGPAELVGTNPVRSEAGIASILLKTKAKTGCISITADAKGMSISATEKLMSLTK